MIYDLYYFVNIFYKKFKKIAHTEKKLSTMNPTPPRHGIEGVLYQGVNIHVSGDKADLLQYRCSTEKYGYP
jgi:hypothetical protein